MRGFFHKIILFLLLLCLVSVTTIDNLQSLSFVNPYEVVKPVNKRITNNLSDFEHSKYIDWQLERFMVRSDLKGVSLSLVKDGRLVFSKGYGFANEEEHIETSPQHLFRIASVSKLITAVAILKLKEEGKLSLDDKVFGPEGYFNEEQFLDIRDKRLNDITINHLLNHTAGWTQRYGDPAFNVHVIAERMNEKLPLDITTYIKFAVSRRLHFTPGSMYSYSNMGYMFLGAIIERITEMSYERYVQNNILFPNDIFDMHIAGNLYNERYYNEVKYYEHEGSSKVIAANGDTTFVVKPYGGNDIRLLGAAGGWIASAPELAKFITLIDNNHDIPDILTQQSIELMTKPHDNRPLGWSETLSDTWIRTGSFSGSAAMIKRQSNGLTWIFLSNTSNWKGPGFSRDIERLMNRITRRVEQWPDQNLFNYFSPEALSYKPESDLLNPIN
jgi:CubicO group peptidase (beta-lactamase class C family)